MVSRYPTTYAPLARGAAQVQLEVEEAGDAHALVVWHTLRLTDQDDGLAITTAPVGADPAARQVKCSEERL